MQQQPPVPALWTLVLPVQRGEFAKSRLLAPPGVQHAGLARAMALDALAAVRSCALVRHRIVVTSDQAVAVAASAAGDIVIADDARGLGGDNADGLGGGNADGLGGDDADGLGAAVGAGLAHADRLAATSPVAVLLADLPALTPGDLQMALEAARHHRLAFVADADETGTVLLTGRRPGRLPFAFGTGSAARHQGLGAVRLDLQLPRLRRDVDTLGDLRSAAALGLGPRTRSALATAHETFRGSGHFAGSACEAGPLSQ